jgi:hypothetical protein
MAERYLDQYRDEIITLYRDRRYSQVRIRKYLEDNYGLEVPKATMSLFIKALPASISEPEVTPEAEHFLEQYEVYQSLVQGIKGATDVIANVHGRMAVLEDAAAERHQAQMEALLKLVRELEDALDKRHDAMIKALQGICDAIPKREDIENAIKAAMQGIDSQDPRLNAIQEALRKQSSDISAIRRNVSPVWNTIRKHAPWMKAALFTGLFWLAVIVGTMYYYNLWRYLPWWKSAPRVSPAVFLWPFVGA